MSELTAEQAQAIIDIRTHDMDVIAERKLKCVMPNGDEHDVVVRIGRPYVTRTFDDMDLKDWSCPYSITGIPSRPEVRMFGSGGDAVMALQAAFSMAATELECSSEEWQLSWYGIQPPFPGLGGR